MDPERHKFCSINPEIRNKCGGEIQLSENQCVSYGCCWQQSDVEPDCYHVKK